MAERKRPTIQQNVPPFSSFGLDTPESGVLGRVALGNRLTRLITIFTVLFALLIANLTYIVEGRNENVPLKWLSLFDTDLLLLPKVLA
ncbi:hypothetical protein ACTND8_11375 [Atopobiaceae bacterium HCP3S3_F7]